MKVTEKVMQYGEHTLTLQTGKIARQASAAVFVSMGDTKILVTVVGRKEPKPGQDFFPLTVNYLERFYAAGGFPGGFMKRESRPSTQEILTSRLIDRPIRPLFPEGFMNEVQIVATVMSLDPEINGDIPAMIGASAALKLSGIPFSGPIGGARVGYIDGQYILNPTATQLKDSKLDLVVAGTSHAVSMVESGALELSKDVMLGAVLFGHREMQAVITAINEFADEAGIRSWDWTPPAHDADAELVAKVAEVAKDQLIAAYAIVQKQKRCAELDAVKARVIAAVAAAMGVADPAEIAGKVKKIIGDIEYRVMRDQVLDTKKRIDGRDTTTVRPISIELGILPRAHGSACFTRGETQAIVVATLGTENDAQTIDVPSGESSERFMLHYNFPAYCTGETGPMLSPKRREIGHGNLAKRALLAVVPDKTVSPYVVRIVSEITESNGSSSMASVCGGSLALMDAGVPVKAAVAGIAMGLIKEGDRFVVLTDILGDEDHLGDMDFKVAGTTNGITALQMDIKIDGITAEIMDVALQQAEHGRMHILNLMQEKIAAPREHVSDFAPRILTIKISTDKIRDVIGKGGATIRSIVDETGATIDISDDGLVTIAAVDRAAGQAALDRVTLITAEPEVGRIYTGKVMKIMDFGAFVNILPNRDGLVHISQIANTRVANVADYLTEGQVVRVKVLDVDNQGKIKLSMKEVEAEEALAEVV